MESKINKPLTETKNEEILQMIPSKLKGVNKLEALVMVALLLTGLYLVASKHTSVVLEGLDSSNQDLLEEERNNEFRRVFWASNLLIVTMSFFLLPRKQFRFAGLSAFYRLLQALAIAYTLNMMLWALMSPEMLKSYLNILDPSLAKQDYKERDFSIDCRVYTPENPDSKFANVMGTLDVFVTGHLFGWFVKSLIFRNNVMAWTMSSLFEVHELCLKHWLPNFNECWWDHLFLDLFGMNLLGLLLGAWVMSKLKIEKFHWFFDPTDHSENMSYLQRFFYSFTAVKDYVSSHKWHFLARPKSFLAVTYVMFLASVTDLSWFFLKNALNLAPSQTFMGIRIWVVGLFSVIVMYDFHKWVKRTGKKRRISFNVVIGHLMLILEMVVFWKNKRDDFFDQATPNNTRITWGVMGVLFVCGLYVSHSHGKQKFLKPVNE